MSNQTVNGQLAAENIVDHLNARESILRWKEDGGGDKTEELILSADHFSPVGTELLRKYHGISNALVIDDNEKHRYVVAREVLDISGPPSRRKRFRRWIAGAPIRLYGQWRAVGEGASALLPWNRAQDRYFSAEGRWVGYRRKVRLEVGGWREFSSWLRSFPWRRWREKAIGRWHVAGSVRRYYVDPNFYEPMGYEDFLGGLRDHYPPPPSGDSAVAIDFNIWNGRVSFKDPAHALRYAGDLERSMHEIGVICSPVVGVGGYTDRPRITEGQPAELEPRANDGLPQLEESRQEVLVFDMATLEHRRRRSADLQRRLRDPNIPDQRKTEIRRALREERELEHNAARNLEERPREEIYGFTLSLARERDRITQEKRHAECLLEALREDLTR